MKQKKREKDRKKREQRKTEGERDFRPTQGTQKGIFDKKFEP